MSDDKTRIMYVPGAPNVYSYAHDTVILDEQLKDYPKAHDLIKRHELTHAEQKANGDGLTEFLKLEFEADKRTYFGDSEAIEEVREYYDNRVPVNHSPRVFDVGNFIRSCWVFGMVVLAMPVSAVKRCFK